MAEEGGGGGGELGGSSGIASRSPARAPPKKIVPATIRHAADVYTTNCTKNLRL